jgi:hypothetical protein
MPVLSKFYGIVIRMVFLPEFKAHFHAFYEQSELVVGVTPITVLQGDAPARVREMVIEWANKHQIDLMEAWNRCRTENGPQLIQPLE